MIVVLLVYYNLINKILICNFYITELDLKCNEDYDCSALQNARCNLGFCRCKNDFVASNDKSTCLPSMRLTSVCEEDSQCNTVMNRSACDYVTRQCVCQRGFRRDLLRMQCVEIARKLETTMKLALKCIEII